MRTGEVLWTAAGAVQRVFDAAAGSGQVVVVGEGAAAIEALDLRTGQVTFRGGGEDGSVFAGPRWVRMSARGEVVVGTSQGVVGVNLAGGQLSWTAHAPVLGAPLDGWILGPHVLILSADRGLHLGQAATGGFEGPGLAVNDTLEAASRLDARLVDDRIVVTSARGMVVFDASGLQVGVDGLGPQVELAPAVVTERGILSIERVSSGAGYRVFRFDFTGRAGAPPIELLLAGDPQETAALDGWLLIDTGAGIAGLALPAD